MRRRLTLVITGMVAGALLLAGVSTLFLTVRSARNQTRHDLVRQAQGVAQTVKDEASTPTALREPARLKAILASLRRPLSLEGEAVLAVADNGQFFDVATPRVPPVLPSGLVASDLKPQALLAGQTVSGTKGSIVYAAAPFRADVRAGPNARSVLLPNQAQAVILTRSPPTGLRAAGVWFIVAAMLTLAAAVLAADWLGRRITRPLEAAESATRRIAAGDLSAQVPVPPRADPETTSLARSINTMAESLNHAKSLERQFLLSVSHDLRTPLTSIRGYSEAIADGTAIDSVKAANVISAEAGRLERLVQDLLDLAKLDARSFSFEVRPVDWAEVVAGTSEGFRLAARDLGLSMAVEPDPIGTISMNADPDRLAQVVANLIENAIKYATSEIRVVATVADGRPTLWVEDDGPGIAPEDLPHVFDRLYISSRYPARKVGSGLGLAIVAELVHAMGGTVGVDSPITASQGTRVTVTFPRPAQVEEPVASLTGSE